MRYSGALPWSCPHSAAAAKIILLFFENNASVFRNDVVQLPRSVSARGASGLSSPNARRNAMDATAAQDVRRRRVRSSRVVLSPRRWGQVNRDDLFATVAKKPGTPGRSRSSRKTIARGMPDRSALPVVTKCLCAFYPFLHTRLRVRLAPGIPCALCFPEGHKTMHSSDATAPRER
jgi:hypothetical protein